MTLWHEETEEGHHPSKTPLHQQHGSQNPHSSEQQHQIADSPEHGLSAESNQSTNNPGPWSTYPMLPSSSFHSEDVAEDDGANDLEEWVSYPSSSEEDVSGDDAYSDLEDWVSSPSSLIPSSTEEDVAGDDADSDHISEKSASSCASFESDNSKKVKVDFQEGQSPPRVPLKRRASTGSNCLNDRSQDHIDAKRRRSGSPCVSSSSSSSSSSSEEDVAADDGDRDTTSDSKESTTSSVSFKSDQSKDKIINF